MRYFSTRGQTPPSSRDLKSFSDIVLEGLAPDGGLYIPEHIPTLKLKELQTWSYKSYNEIAENLLQLYAPELPAKDILKTSTQAFRDPAITPLKTLEINNSRQKTTQTPLYIGELFHGPTYAFKDVALQFLGQVFQHLLQKRNEKLTLLGATSGDTGGAAIYGVRGMENIQLSILHPHNSISEVQRKQMCTVLDKNICNIAIRGNFDECQSMVKEIMAQSKTDPNIPKIGSINSINWGRILAQMSYYFALYFALLKQRHDLELGQNVRFIVPTGNFGNVLAGYFCKKMGLPIDLVVACNQNDIVHRCINQNRYEPGQTVSPSHAPAMDIVQPSNFERYLWYLYNGNAEEVITFVNRAKTGELQQLPQNLSKQIRCDFGSGYATDSEILAAISECWQNFGYVLDPHTACAYHVWRSLPTLVQDSPSICLATAHPAKFPEAYKKAPDSEDLDSVHFADLEIPAELKFAQSKERFVVLERSSDQLLQYLRQNVW